jgi:hypothetical protein
MGFNDSDNGWGAPPGYPGSNKSSDGSSNGDKYKAWGFSVPRPGDELNPFGDEQATKQVMFLSDRPRRVWMHKTYMVEGAKGLRDVLCLAKNGIDDRGCPMDAKELKSITQFFGHHTVIDMGFVEFDGRGGYDLIPTRGRPNKETGEVKEYQFGQRALSARWGGTDSPGVLQTFEYEMKKRGLKGMAGTVWHTRRGGGKTERVGDHWELKSVLADGTVRVLRPDEWKKWLVSKGADASKLKLDLIDWDDHFKDSPDYDELARRFGHTEKGKEGSGQGSGQRVEGADWSRSSDSGGSQQNLPSDDIPF